MTTMTATKVADIRYRVELKNRHGIVIYKSKSSDGQRDYETTLVNGKVSSCTCPAHQKQNVECYIMRDVLVAEAVHIARKRQEDALAMAELAAEVVHEAAREMMHATARMPERTRRSSLNNRELHFEDGILMR